MNIDHWMMFGTFAQQDYFAYPGKETYRGVIINANMVAHAPAGLAAFLHEKTRDATYIIDPLTHAFQHDPRSVANAKGETKSSVVGIAAAYGEPVDSHVGNRPLMPSHLSNQEHLREFVRQCIKFQSDHLKTYMQQTKAAKYLDPEERDQEPYAIVAPYFYMSETTVDAWLDLNLRCIQMAREESNGSARIFASVVLDQGAMVDEDLRQQIVRAYSNTAADGYLVWIDDFNEQAASRQELQSLVALAKALRGNDDNEVINLHGGFFSILAASVLGGHAFTGVTHGPEFGEYRGVVPVGGGIPISRYYIPQLHSRVRYGDALAMLKELGWLDTADEFHSNVCDCRKCQEVLDGDAARFTEFGAGTVKSVKRKHGVVRISFPTRAAREACLCHYLQRKDREYKAASIGTSDVLVRSVSRGYHDFKPVAGLEGVKHLKLWLRALGHDVVEEDELA